LDEILEELLKIFNETFNNEIFNNEVVVKCFYYLSPLLGIFLGFNIAFWFIRGLKRCFEDSAEYHLKLLEDDELEEDDDEDDEEDTDEDDEENFWYNQNSCIK